MRKSIPYGMALPLMLVAAVASAQGKLPKCPGSYDAKTWTNCFVELKRPSGIKFAAEFKDGKPNGYGTATSPNGDKYVGELRDGTQNGAGTAVWKGGLKYSGEWQDGEMNGQGTKTWPGGKYVGGFKDNKFHGQGTEYNSKGAAVRSGVWENDALVKSQ